MFDEFETLETVEEEQEIEEKKMEMGKKEASNGAGGYVREPYKRQAKRTIRVKKNL